MRLDHFNPCGLRKGSATHAVSWHPIMATHQELNDNNLAGIFKAPCMTHHTLNNQIRATHHVLFLGACFQLVFQITTATTQLTGARKRSTIFVTKPASCAWRKKKVLFFVLADANNSNKLTKLEEHNKMHKNSQLLVRDGLASRWWLCEWRLQQQAIALQCQKSGFWTKSQALLIRVHALLARSFVCLFTSQPDRPLASSPTG